jgi:hypothetical protein
MSVYIYAFEKKAIQTPEGIAVHPLTFRRGNAQDLAADRLAVRIENSWEPEQLEQITHFIEGKPHEGALVYQVRAPIHSALWYDTLEHPGKPKVVGALTKVRGRWRVTRYFAVERYDVKERMPGFVAHLPESAEKNHWVPPGMAGLDYATAVIEANRLNEDAGKCSVPVYFEPVADRTEFSR